jgi:hypothetical protein
MKNNAYLGESREKRLKRFQNNHPTEIIDTLLNSMASYFINELRTVFNNPNPANYQTSLMILGTHSIALTIAYGLFNKGGEMGYKLFLEHFIDGDSSDKKFSTVASEIHEWRNVIAHRWLNFAGHNFSYEFDMLEGWKKEDDFLLINPRIYLEQYLKTFGPNGKIYGYKKVLTTDEMLEAAKQRFISQYIEEA